MGSNSQGDGGNLHLLTTSLPLSAQHPLGAKAWHCLSKALPTTLKAWLHISSLLFPDSPVLAELPRHSTPASARVLHLEPRENSLNFPQQFRATLSFLQAVPKEPHYI